MATNGETEATKEDNQCATDKRKDKANSETAEKQGQNINPSAPEDANVTPGTTATK